jgi:hypothetical protein
MWWIIIIIAIIVLGKWLDIKSKREIRRKAAQEYLDEQRKIIAEEKENDKHQE